MAATTKDIARICNVSRTTVTRALYNQGRISEKTRNEVLRVAKELGYQPDLLARSLVKGRSMTIGVVLCDLKNMFFPNVIDAMEPVARERGYVLNITLHDNDTVLEREIIRHLQGYKIDGMVIHPSVFSEEEYEYLKGLNFPVLIATGIPLGELSFVGNNEYEAAKSATEQILRREYDILYFVFPEFERVFAGHQERYRGFSETAKDAGKRYDILGSENYIERALSIIRETSREEKRAAFLCSGDVYAAHIMMAAYQEHLIAGIDYGLMGFDNNDLMKILPVRLWTVENHKEEIGKRAIEELTDVIAQKKDGRERISIPFEIVRGNSL